MGNSWITDISHYLDEVGCLAPKSGPVFRFAEYLVLRNPFYLDSESGFNWTANPDLTGHLIRF